MRAFTPDELGGGRARTAVVWVAAHELEADAPPEAVWALWEDAGRWPEWNEDIEWARLQGPLVAGARARIKFCRSVALDFAVTAVEPGRAFTDETRLPGVRMGHEHRVEPIGGRSLIRNRVYLDGPLAPILALAAGRRIDASVVRFVERERELAEAAVRR